jgi:hypothetical protein
MSLAAEEDDGVDVQRTAPRPITFADLPRQPLDQGRGSVREVWADLDNELNLRWLLRVVEIKDSTGLLVGPAGTHHFVVGLAGPQVAVRTAEASRVLRRDHVLPVLSATLLFERPKLRPPGASSLLVLTFVGAADPPGFVIRTADVDAELPPEAQVLIALRGTVKLDGAEAGQGTALLLDPALRHRPTASTAHLLTVHRPGFDEETPGPPHRD